MALYSHYSTILRVVKGYRRLIYKDFIKITCLEGILTINKILKGDDIGDLLAEVHEKRFEVDQFFLVYTDDDGTPHYYWHGTKERIVYALECGKNMIINGDDED
jgi:hypothetical protein